MFKETIISTIIVITIIVGNIVTQNYTKKCIETIGDELNLLKSEITQEEANKDKINNHIKNIDVAWNEMYKKLAFYIEHDELEKVYTELSAIKGNVEVEEYEQSIPEIEKCTYILHHIKDKEALKIQNIF